jgi:hypothetical protein
MNRSHACHGGRKARLRVLSSTCGQDLDPAYRDQGHRRTMVPLETVTERGSDREALRVVRKAKPPAPMPAKPREPRRFRVVEVISRRNLVDDASAGNAIDTLRAVRSIVDVNIYVWQPDRGRWKLLTSPSNGRCSTSPQGATPLPAGDVASTCRVGSS